MIDVLVDMTALDTPSRHRGIGCYVRGLCGALAQLAPDSGLSIAGLTRLRGSPELVVDPTLGFAGDPALRTSSLQYQGHKMRRRLLLGSTARNTGARLLHLADAHGTPFDLRMPRLTTCQDLIPLVLHRLYPRPGGRRAQWARAFARYRTADRVVASSHSTRDDLVEQLGLEPARIDVVHLGVDHDRYVPQAGANEREQVNAFVGFSGPFALYLGAADARKNVPLLIRGYAASGLAGELPLVLAGPHSERQDKQMRALIAELGLGRDVHLAGYVPDELVAPLYRQCFLHVFPSSYEGFGLPVLEAMACGAPTISSTASSLAEVAGDAALPLAELSADAIAAAITKVAGDSELRDGLRRQGLAHAARFTWERCATGTLKCYASMLR
jgi:glycosyltransferase involved in cell wall biosynthesis